jgi:hypothetical protein
VSIRPPDLLDSEPQLRVYQIYPLGKVCVLFACPLVLRFACSFKDVLGTARTTQIGGGVTVAKAQRSPCGVVVGQHNVDPPQIELSPHSHRKIGSKPQRVPSWPNWCHKCTSSLNKVASEFFTTCAPDPLHWTQNTCFGVFGTISVMDESRCETGRTSAIKAQVR